MTIYERTESIAKDRGLSMPELEKKAGLGEKSIYSWKRSTPNSDKLARVADVLHVSTDYLLGRTAIKNVESNKVPKADILDDETILAFDGMEISEEDKEKLRDYARFIIEQRQRGKK